MNATDPIRRMMDEHRVIERVLTALSRHGEAAAQGADVDRQVLSAFVEFLRGYADAIHHGKEERIVFVALRRHGTAAALGHRLAAIERDHDTARLLIDDLAALARREGAWTERDRERLARTVGEYVSLLRRHIRQEDDVVFPETWAAMPAALQESVSAACATFDEEHAARAAELRALAQRLEGGGASQRG